MLEQTWSTKRWANRVFAFLLAIMEVNMYQVLRYFVWEQNDNMTLLEFCRRLADELINNREYMEEIKRHNDNQKRAKRGQLEHELCLAPPHAKIFVANRWDCTAKAWYQQYVCRGIGCKKQVRTYCCCSPTQWMCRACFQEHVVQQAIANRNNH